LLHTQQLHLAYPLSSIAKILGLSVASEQSIAYLAFDSRKIIFPQQTLFFALATSHRNGHAYLADAYAKGVRAFVVSENVAPTKMPDAVFLHCENSLLALQKIAAHHRRQFAYPVVAITGSNGKTIVKEWLYQLLEKDLSVVRSPKSFNSQLGVPLSIWQLQANHQLAIIEAGISEPGEMSVLAPIIQPNIGVLTNIGTAHAEHFANQQQLQKEKLQLFANVAKLCYSPDNTDAATMQAFLAAHPTIQTITWSFAQMAELTISITKKTNNSTALQFVYQSATANATTNFTDDASLENIASCVAALLALGFSLEKSVAKLPALQTVEMRLQLKKGINQCSLINDSYSNDFTSLQIALDFLQQQEQHLNKTVILAPILQSGVDEATLYANIAALLQQKKVNRLIGIGNALQTHGHLFASIERTIFFDNTAAFVQQFASSSFKNEAILIKGARSFELEKIEALLEAQQHQTVLSINLSNLAQNLKTFQQQLQPGTKTMAMVKAFSYGAGSAEVANTLQFNKVDYLAVAYTDEGVDLRKAGIVLPIMVMNPDSTSFQQLVEHNLEPELYSFDIFDQFIAYLKDQGIPRYPVHLKIDTGMHRLGFVAAALEQLCMALQQQPILVIQSVFSHLVASEDPAQDAFTQAQGLAFVQACQQIERAIGYGFLKHIANTSGISRHPNLQFDMVRLGIGLYGVHSSQANHLALKTVGTLRTTIAQIKYVKAGQSVGYGRKIILQKDATVATIRIGYADGFPRALSNGAGKVWLNGQLYAVIGNVCMDMTMIDVTDANNLQVGDAVEIFGADLPVQTLAKWAGTIAYELLTGISQRVRRIYFEE
jgi:Alr-MurF fusion protein